MVGTAGSEDLTLASRALHDRPLETLNAEDIVVSSVLSDTCAMGLPLPAAANLRSAGGAGVMLMMNTWSHPLLKPVPWTRGQGLLGAPPALGIMMPVKRVTLTLVSLGDAPQPSPHSQGAAFPHPWSHWLPGSLQESLRRRLMDLGRQGDGVVVVSHCMQGDHLQMTVSAIGLG